MANQELLDLLKQGSSAWNAQRAQHREVRPDLRDADLSYTYLRGANLAGENPEYASSLLGTDMYAVIRLSESQKDVCIKMGGAFFLLLQLHQNRKLISITQNQQSQKPPSFLKKVVVPNKENLLRFDFLV